MKFLKGILRVKTKLDVWDCLEICKGAKLEKYNIWGITDKTVLRIDFKNPLISMERQTKNHIIKNDYTVNLKTR